MADRVEEISKEEAIYDLKRHYSHAKQVYEGDKPEIGLTKEGAYRRMQVFQCAIDNLEKS